MIELEGDALKRYLADAVAAKDQERAQTLARARRQAPEGKEPFSLDVLERHYALGSVFASDPPADREARGRELEYLYYVVHREVLSLRSFAKQLEQGDRYR